MFGQDIGAGQAADRHPVLRGSAFLAPLSNSGSITVNGGYLYLYQGSSHSGAIRSSISAMTTRRGSDPKGETLRADRIPSPHGFRSEQAEHSDPAMGEATGHATPR